MIMTMAMNDDCDFNSVNIVTGLMLFATFFLSFFAMRTQSRLFSSEAWKIKIVSSLLLT